MVLVRTNNCVAMSRFYILLVDFRRQVDYGKFKVQMWRQVFHYHLVFCRIVRQQIALTFLKSWHERICTLLVGVTAVDIVL